MKNNQWKGAMKSFEDHISSEKDEQLNAMKIEINNKVKRILKFAKNVNPGNKDGNVKKKEELIHLIEEFDQQYNSLYSLYEDLREEVKKKVTSGDDDNSYTSASDSESYYTPQIKSRGASNDSYSDYQEAESSTTLKDKLTSSSEVMIIPPVDTSQRLAEISVLEGEVENLKQEILTLCNQKRQLEEQVELKSAEVMQMKEKLSRFENWISDIEASSEENERKFCALRKQYEENEQGYLSRILDLEAQSKNLLLQKAELELELKNKAEETSECLNQIETLRNELSSWFSDENAKMVEKKEDLKFQVKDLEVGIHSIRSNKSDLQEQIKRINHETLQSNIEKEEQNKKISELQIALSEKENDLFTEQNKLNAYQSDIKSLTEQVKILENKADTLQKEKNVLLLELESSINEEERLKMELEKQKQESSISKSHMERKNTELTNKISEQQTVLLELGDTMAKLKDEKGQAQTKYFQIVDRKTEEMAEEFRKQFEAKYKIMSRRIRIAEQLHTENKECYLRTKRIYEQENKELRERVEMSQAGIKNVKGISLTANDVLTSLDSVALKFEECNAHFLNRISKASCELKFSKDWAMRKNKVLLHAKDDLDCLLAQLDDKEAEILVFRERVWKSENKVRELEKIITEKEDGMLALKEEKREAIRQLCVWIDYNHSRSDYYKKMLFEMNHGRNGASLVRQ